jgi:SPP1 gp7 family putative phage head morphogenesis protein
VAENIAAGEKLNGIQIQAALTVIRDFINSQIPNTVATELLVAVGIDRERAAAMIAEASRFTPKPIEEPQDNTRIIPPTEPNKQRKELKSKLTEEQKELNWKAYAASAEGFEKQFIPKIKGMFAAQEKEVLKAVRSGATSNPFNKDKAKKQYVNVAKPVLSSVLKWAITDAQEIMPQKSLKSSTAYEAALKWLGTRLTWAAEAISEETAIKLDDALSAGWEAGEGADELAKRVSAVFDMSDMRAERIARTETMQASAQGAVEGYKELGVQEVEFFAAMDERLCEDCNALHGEKFAVADSVGVITVHPNCRCKWLPVVEG